MDSSLALIISILAILALIRLKMNISLSIFIGALILGLLTLGINSLTKILLIITGLNTIKIVTIVLLAFTLGYSMEYFKLLEKLAFATQNMLDSFSVAVLPALLGFLPMPGGALISAVMIKDLVKKYEIDSETATYINYWFRHLWVPTWPLYPSFIIALAVVEVNYIRVIEANYPITIAAIAVGLYFIRHLGIKFRWSSNDFKQIVISLYPIIIITLLALLVRLDLLVTLLMSLLILYLHKKPNIGDLKNILSKTIDVKLIVLVMAVMSFKGLIEETNAALAFFNHLNTANIPIPLAAFLLSFTIGFATGIEMSYTSIALPLLTAFTGISSTFNAANFMIVFAAGYLGVMISPLHLCLVLTTEYYKADIRRVYRMLIPTMMATTLIVLFVFLSAFSLIAISSI
ncbi:hypothetical protein DRP05_07305 [Archaeoglobales archaeon]|nr:MAG: hypothetical protein DRP05_07305 [Archaeoglobales archaeon]